MRPPQGKGRDHKVDPRAVGEPCIHRRSCRIEPLTGTRCNPLSDQSERGLRGKLLIAPLKHARPLDKNLCGTVHHDLVDRCIVNKGLDRTKAKAFLQGCPDQQLLLFGIEAFGNCTAASSRAKNGAANLAQQISKFPNLLVT